RQAIHPDFSAQVPYVLADVQLEEGPIMTSNVTDIDPEGVSIGMPVRVWFDEELEDAFHVKLTLPKFRPQQTENGWASLPRPSRPKGELRGCFGLTEPNAG